MIDALQVQYSLRVFDTEDWRGDEPRLEFVFVTGHQRRTQVYVQDGGQLANNYAGGIWARGSSTIEELEAVTPIVPYSGSPFFGFGVRAMENDATSPADRRQARRTMMNDVEASLDPIFRSGGTPGTSNLWLAMNGARLPQSGDEDDKIGVSARVYPDLYSRFRGNSDGTTLVTDEFRFRGDGAHWLMNWRLVQFRL
ncbi:hypothetical protein [Halocynthiibacter sp.]|uniref:hypothetical protein n=1 Tax=Halocynthiibacter sp. TaxID=1979210 RepID=UPI003C4B94D3